MLALRRRFEEISGIPLKAGSLSSADFVKLLAYSLRTYSPESDRLETRHIPFGSQAAVAHPRLPYTSMPWLGLQTRPSASRGP